MTIENDGVEASSNAAFLSRMLQFGDSMFPIGAFAFSSGLESAIQEGVVTNAATLRAFARTAVEQAARGDCIALIAAHRAATAGDVDALTRIDAQVYARKLSDEARTMSIRMLAAAISGEPLLAHWTQTFMPGAGRFVTQWFPMFLLGGLFGKLMDDSGSITSIARFLTERLGTRRTILSVVLASAAVTYGGVSVFVAFFVLVPMAKEMFQAANIPRRLMPATIGLGAFTFTMSAMPGTPSVNNAIPMPYFGTTTFAAPGLGIIASIIIFVIGMAVRFLPPELLKSSPIKVTSEVAGAAAETPTRRSSGA